MTPSECNANVLTPALALLPGRMDTKPARRLLLAIALQESGLIHRRQVRGPAVSFWQFEPNGIIGVLRHPASSAMAESACAARGVPADLAPVYDAMERDDVLGACFARLLLWTDPRPMPTKGAEGWTLYLRCWRPGKPHPARWPMCWNKAVEALQ